MNFPNKKMILPAVFVAVIGAGAYGISAVHADSAANGGSGSLVQKLADTFHLDKSKVQAVFDQNRQARIQQMETNYENRLNQGVTDGKLTSSEKDTILAEHKKLKSELDAARSAGTDRKTEMTKIMSEAQTWATQNNIDVSWLAQAHPHFGGSQQ